MATSDAIDAMKEAFPDLGLEAAPLCRHLDGRESDQLWVRVPPERLIEVMTFLRNDPRTKFEQLSDLAGIDYLEFPDATDRFAVIYSLLSLTHNHRLWVKAFVNDPDPSLESVTGIWAAADWPEREVFDMFGIRFENHPDLRRILTPDEFEDHPLRKDYPLRGRGEREQFEVVRRDSA